jgi:hypothetical protein
MAIRSSNLWGEDHYRLLREALLGHSWRLITYLFDWCMRLIHDLLHPRPKIQMPSG